MIKGTDMRTRVPDTKSADCCAPRARRLTAARTADGSLTCSPTSLIALTDAFVGVQVGWLFGNVVGSSSPSDPVPRSSLEQSPLLNPELPDAG
jgi:hypothetical protein